MLIHEKYTNEGACSLVKSLHYSKLWSQITRIQTFKYTEYHNENLSNDSMSFNYFYNDRSQ